jgi:hypothetical protein
MTKPKHTPGPWSIESGPHKTMTGEAADWSITCCKGIVAMLHDNDTIGPRHERDANACLIAAAPDLCDTLQEMMAAHQRMDPHPPEGCSNCTLARAALEKAGLL